MNGSTTEGATLKIIWWRRNLKMTDYPTMGEKLDFAVRLYATRATKNIEGG
jgi:hypothetical protein